MQDMAGQDGEMLNSFCGWKEQKHEMNADAFLQLVRRYTDIHELTPDLLHSFIDKIVVHHREQRFGEMVQDMEIYYKMIGYIELPEMSRAEKESYIKSFGIKEIDQSAWALWSEKKRHHKKLCPLWCLSMVR